MREKKLVKKSLPCSFYDIQGVHSWLDEMALQGLFLHHLSDHTDRAYFERGEPRPVRYRLDPIGKNWNDMERKENYAQMGWEFVDAIPTHFYIFSCDDPSLPELYSDPGAMGYALSRLLRRKTRLAVLGLLALFLITGFLLFLARENIVGNLILWENPLIPLYFLIYLILDFSVIIATVIGYRRRWNACRTLELGLPLNAGRRRWQPPYFVVFLSIYIPFVLLSQFGYRYTTVKTCDPSALSHPWQTAALAALENPGAPAAGYSEYAERNILTPNTAPVQEHFSLSENKIGGPYVSVQYFQTSSSTLAQRVFAIKQDEAFHDLESWGKAEYGFRVMNLTPFTPQEWPGLDRLEVCRYQRFGLDNYTFTVQRDCEVLVVEYVGHTQLEECLPLFLEVLDQ